MLNPCEYTIHFMFKRQIFKEEYRSELAKIARRQLARMNRYQMRKQGGKGVANHPFYTMFLNR